ncbi:hypothetical protein ACFWBF_26640 [Streptomyces sp. NPDC060028]|uniref:hypothetical protein n=1 Tax=Streptomyces sp. NPDC060028 TaxID=3347041 RepID=UPI0036A5CEEE
MRIKSLLTTVIAVTALLPLTACGSGADQAIGGIGGDSVVGGTGEGDGGPNEGTLDNPTKNGGVNGNAPKNGTAFQQLPKAATMAAAARYVNGYTKCTSVATDKNDYEYWDDDAQYDAKWSVTERGDCGKGTRIFMLKDPKAFQAAYKASIDAELAADPKKGINGGFAVGQDFAVIATSRNAITAMTKPGGLFILNCNPNFAPPSGYVKEKALVSGCVLTDYFKD